MAGGGGKTAGRVVNLVLLGVLVGFPLQWAVPGIGQLAGSLACPAGYDELVVVADRDALLDGNPVWSRAYCVAEVGAPAPASFARIGLILAGQVLAAGLSVLLLLRVLRGLPARNRSETYVPPDPQQAPDPTWSPFE